MRNFKLKISEIIRKEFYQFMRENPTWYDDVDWDYWASAFVFLLQSNKAAIEIEKFLRKEILNWKLHKRSSKKPQK